MIGLGLGIPKTAVVGQGAGGEAPALDGLTTFAAYSFSRKLYTSYAGNCIEVRRSSDSTTQNIGFDADGNLDAAALATFCGANSGFIRTVYDQSGAGLNLTQTTTANQPRIVNAGVLETIGGKPAAFFDGTNDALTRASVAASGNAWSFMGVAKRSDTIYNWRGMWSWGTALGTADSAGFLIPTNVPGSDFVSGTACLFADGWQSGLAPRVVSDHGTPLADEFPTIWDGTVGAATKTLRRNGTVLPQKVGTTGTAYTGTNTLSLGVVWQGTINWKGWIAELFVANSDIDTSLAAVRANATTYYGAAENSRPARGIKGVPGQTIPLTGYPTWEYTQPRTVMWTMNAKKRPPSFAVLWGNVRDGPNYPGWEVGYNPTGNPFSRDISNITTSNCLGTYASITAPSSGAAYEVCDGADHVIMVTDDGSGTLAGKLWYIDGVLVGTRQESATSYSAVTASIVDAGAPMRIAGQRDDTNVDGSFDMQSFQDMYNIAVFDSVKDAAFAAAHATFATFPTVADSPHYLTDFSERSGTTLADDSGNGYTGTLMSTSLWIT